MFGFVISAYSLGTLVGALAGARLTRGGLGRLLLVGGALVGLFVVAVTIVVRPQAVAALSLVAGVANSLVLVSYVTIRAASTPDVLLGRVGATTRMTSIGLAPLGAALAGLMLDSIGAGGTLRLMGGGLVVVALVGAASRTLGEARVTPRSAVETPRTTIG